MNFEFVAKLEENIQKFITAYTVKSSESEKKFDEEKTQLSGEFTKINQKIMDVQGFEQQISPRLEEIKLYTDIKYKPTDLIPTHFFKPDIANPITLVETSTVTGLAGLELGPTGSITKAINKIAQLGDVVDADKLINPSFGKTSSGPVSSAPSAPAPVSSASSAPVSTGLKKLHQYGGFSLFESANKKETKIVNSLISKWENELTKAKGKLCKKHYLISTDVTKQDENIE